MQQQNTSQGMAKCKVSKDYAAEVHEPCEKLLFKQAPAVKPAKEKGLAKSKAGEANVPTRHHGTDRRLWTLGDQQLVQRVLPFFAGIHK